MTPRHHLDLYCSQNAVDGHFKVSISPLLASHSSPAHMLTNKYHDSYCLFAFCISSTTIHLDDVYTKNHTAIFFRFNFIFFCSAYGNVLCSFNNHDNYSNLIYFFLRFFIISCIEQLVSLHRRSMWALNSFIINVVFKCTHGLSYQLDQS